MATALDTITTTTIATNENATSMDKTTTPTTTTQVMEVVASSLTSPLSSPPPTPAALNQLQSKALITTATQTALRRQDIPTMYHIDWDENTIASQDSNTDNGAPNDLAPCAICGRTFNAASLSKHVSICQKMSSKKRKPFDSSRQRREGTEMAAFLPKNFGLPPSKQISTESEEKFVRSTARASIRKSSAASSNSSNGNISVGSSTATLTPVSPKLITSTHSSRTDRMSSTERPRRGQPLPPASDQCPHCDRFFGIKAYDRHVEWCKEKALQTAIKNSNMDRLKAKERLAARIKYRAPIKTKRSLNREKYSGMTGDENEGDESPKVLANNSSMTSSVASDSALMMSSSYDPFLSAKRQLEDLCAPGSPPDHNDTHNYNTNTLSTPTTPSPYIPTKMSTSLTLSTSIPSHTSSPLTPNISLNRKYQNATSTPTATGTINTSNSNFRRTSSLRGPRRSPLLSARPLFAQKRPTIQRGLSDEGPISTNFLKSEEYDEMPVRSNCVNDFAITNSPRVVRRDTSLSNRKNSLKLNLQDTPGEEQRTSFSDERLVPNTTKDLSKTDSLAVFLKFEKELEKMNQRGEDHENNTYVQPTRNGPTEVVVGKSITLEPRQEISNSNAKLMNQIVTKELKDKSNTLSKQNSAKNLKLDIDSVESPKIVNESPKYEANKSQTEYLESKNSAANESNNRQGPVRLEPIERSNSGTQFTGTANGSGIALPSRIATATNTQTKMASQLPLLTQKIPQQQQQQQNLNLNSIFGNSNTQQTAPLSTASDKENKAYSSSEYIDPKLINKCDNLPVKLADLKYVDSDSSTDQSQHQHQQQQQYQQHHHHNDSYEKYVAPISQLSKLLPLTSKSSTNPSLPSNTLTRNAQTQSTPKHTRSTVDNAVNSGGRNLLKRKMRLGRNQFLYDASPEAIEMDSSCSADDETNPRSSTEYESNRHQVRSNFEDILLQQQQQHQHQQSPQFHFTTPHSPSMTTALPIFDDFDFEDFLSSFENDDEQFPLFKDCREFLRNRSTTTTTNKQQRSPHPQQQQQQPQPSPLMKSMPNRSTTAKQQIPNNSSQNFFQFPVLTQNNTTNTHFANLLTPSTRRSNSKTNMMGYKESVNDSTAKSDDFQSARSDSNSTNSSGISSKRHYDENDDSKMKREIFISIETEQSDEMGRTSISPNSLRNIVGNTQAIVEVEVDGSDNKFSKISDDDDEKNENTNNGQSSRLSSSSRMSAEHLPNVQLNNARNLMQKIHDDNNTNNNNNNNEEKRHSSDKAAGSGAGTTGDSDEMSSLDGYPATSNSSSRRSAGVTSKMSADSAYGSLSRQRSTELMAKSAPRSATRPRPATASPSISANNAGVAAKLQQQQFMLQQQYQQQIMLQQHQQQLKFAQAMMKGARTRHLSGSSSSGSDNSLPPIVMNSSNNNFHQQHLLMQQQPQQQHQQQQQMFQQKPRSRGSPTTAYAMDMLNANHPSMMIASTTSSPGIGANSTSSSASSSHKPMSRFCHECGQKFLVEHAKFCMDCGVKRLMI